MRWDEAQIFNEAIVFAVYLGSTVPFRDAPLSQLHKRFSVIWNRQLQTVPDLQLSILRDYTPQISPALMSGTNG